MRLECTKLTRKLYFQLIPLASNPTVFWLQLPSSLLMHLHQVEQRTRDHEMIQHICRARAEQILNSPALEAFVPAYNPHELESWT